MSWYVRDMRVETVIGSKYNGPPNSGNGGYSCGVVAEGIDGVASVRLRVPPPLDTPLILSGDGQASTLMAGEVLVGEAEAVDMKLDVPGFPTLAGATDASTRYVGFDGHIFPTCFVCGPDRAEGDGLRIFAGSVDGHLYAAPWIPHSSLDNGDGLVGRRYIWAALDCPSFFSNPGAPPALLAQLTADIIRQPEIGEPLVVIAWPIETEGRKHHAGSALATAGGEMIGQARALWIEPRGGIPT